MNTIAALSIIQNSLEEKDRLIRQMEQKNSQLTRVLCNIRTSLERSLKNPSLLNQAVYDAIDQCRANFKYMDYSSGETKQDPPLNESEKNLPNYEKQ